MCGWPVPVGLQSSCIMRISCEHYGGTYKGRCVAANVPKILLIVCIAVCLYAPNRPCVQCIAVKSPQRALLAMVRGWAAVAAHQADATVASTATEARAAVAA